MAAIAESRNSDMTSKLFAFFVNHRRLWQTVFRSSIRPNHGVRQHQTEAPPLTPCNFRLARMSDMGTAECNSRTPALILLRHRHQPTSSPKSPCPAAIGGRTRLVAWWSSDRRRGRDGTWRTI
jgi:hypothetical protein